METVTYHVKLLAESNDLCGYTNYVFYNIDTTSYENQYIMCVRFPNWNQSHFNIGDEGFVTCRYVREGLDKWFDGKDFISYRYTNIVFLKFIPLKPKIKPSEIIID